VAAPRNEGIAPPPAAPQDAPAPPDPDPVASEFGFETSGP
jgi:hypothetical protein